MMEAAYKPVDSWYFSPPEAAHKPSRRRSPREAIFPDGVGREKQAQTEGWIT